MSLHQLTLYFLDDVQAEWWFDQLRTQWIVTSTSIEHTTQGTAATAQFAVKAGALIPAPTETEKECSQQ